MEQDLNISMNALTIIEACRNKKFNKVPKCSLVSDCSRPGPPRQRLTKDQLSPKVHSYSIKSKKEAFYSKLQQTCLKQPIAIIRDLTKVLELNLNLFSTEILVETSPNLAVETREQIKFASDKNRDKERNKKSWKCLSYRGRSTISQYAAYQAENLENQENVLTSNNSGQATKNNQTVIFATNVDLSSAKWKPQLEELAKLPPFLRVQCVDNMLSYVKYDLLGMNTVQLYMKVPGCRTSGHQENNNFCSVNINIGPGDCEWFAVPHEYWGVIHSLCEQNDIDYVHESWWPPNLKVLHKKNVPVYKFYQKPGDVVWVNVGCVHWVQAIGWCNNIAWNVGPFTARQYELALERYEWNKLYQYQSIVPMMYLSWKLARRAKVSDLHLFELIKNCLLQTMKQNYFMLRFLKGKGVEVKYVDSKIDHATYCKDCNVEIFITLLYKKKEGRRTVYCLDCALKRSSSLREFSCLKRYRIKRLMKIYDEFTFNE